MQNFVNEERYEPRKRSSGDRVKDFKEIYEIFSREDASAQADRCIQCGDPFCHSKCPLHNYIPFWLKATSAMKRELAFNLSNETNPFPEITGRIQKNNRGHETETGSYKGVWYKHGISRTADGGYY